MKTAKMGKGILSVWIETRIYVLELKLTISPMSAFFVHLIAPMSSCSNKQQNLVATKSIPHLFISTEQTCSIHFN